MKKCTQCGTDNREEAQYCRKCGTEFQYKRYVKPREPWNPIRTGVTLISVVMILTSFGLIMGGTSVTTIQDKLFDQEGFIISEPSNIDVPGYAIVFGDLELEVDPEDWHWIQRRMGVLSIKIVTESKDPDQEIFIGVARNTDIQNYLGNVQRQVLIDRDIKLEDFDFTLSNSHFSLQPGEAPSEAPSVRSFWVAQASSREYQSLVWVPESGRYEIVIMNADGSEGIEANIQLGFRLLFIRNLGNALFTTGVIIGVLGVFMLYLTLKKRHP